MIDKVYLWEDKILILFNFVNNTNDNTDFDFENIAKKILDGQYTCSSNKKLGSPKKLSVFRQLLFFLKSDF